VYLYEKYPNNEFNLIMGEDNLRTFHKWKNHKQILEKSNLYVYPRLINPSLEEKTNSPLYGHSKVKICDAPVMKISSSFIRKAIKNNKDVRYMLSEKVAKYVEEMHFYKK